MDHTSRDWSYSWVVAGEEVTNAGGRERDQPAAPEREQRFRDLRQYVPGDLLDVSFPVSVRGYDRGAVDAYIKRVNRAIAELKVSASPPAAVRHAVDQAEEKVEGLLEAARRAAEEITASAREEAEESTARAKAEAAELIVNTSADADRLRAAAIEFRDTARAEADQTITKVKAEATEILAQATAEAENILARAQAEADERLRRTQEELAAQRHQAETRMREIQADTEAIWAERRQLHDDINLMASSLVDLVNAAAARLPPPARTETEEETPRRAAADRTEPAPAAAAETSPTPATVRPPNGGDDQNHEQQTETIASAPDT
jgi:DivIVA domain-containing protein